MKIFEDFMRREWINRDRKGNPGPDTRFNTVQSITRESPNLEKIVNIILMLRFIKEGGQYQRRRMKELQYFMVGGIEKKEVNIGQIASHSTSYLDAVNILIDNGAIKKVMVLHPAKDGKVNKITFYKYIKDLDVEKAITDLEAKGNRSVRGDTLERYNKAKEILSDPASYNELYADTIVNYTKEFDRATGAFVVAPGHDDFGQDKKDIAEKLAAFIKSKGQMGAKRIEMAKYLIDNVLSKEEAAKWDAKNTNLTSKYDRYLVEKLGIFRIGSRFVSKEFLPDNADQITQPNIDSDKSEPTIDKIDDVTSILEPSSSKSDEDDIIDDSIQESYITKQKRKLLESYMHMLGEGKDRNSLPTQKEVEQYLMKFYPQDTENKLFHDHYGLYSKTPNNTVNKILLCTTATYEVVQKFKAENFDLLVSHHDNIARVPQIIFHSIMDEAEAGHNVYFAKRMGLQNFKKGEVSCAGEIYKPLTLDEFLVYLNKHGFEVKGVIHKNNTVKRDNDLIKSVVYTAGLGGMLINDQSLQGMGWEDNPLFDFRNIEADVYVTGQVISKYDLDNNKFKYIIELSHTTSEKPLFKRIHNQLKNRWPKLTVEVTDNEIDYFGQDRSNKYPEDDFVDPEDEIDDETDLDLEPDNNVHESSKKKLLESYFRAIVKSKRCLIREDANKISWLDYIDKNEMLKVALEVIEILSKYGKAYIVGGAVRDIIMNKQPHDIDIATDLTSDKVEELFKSHNIGKNKSFGIACVEYKGFTFEVATFRKDGSYSDGRRPDTVEIVTDFKDDASRRDFTINAMAIDKDGNIIDYFDGRGDIKNKVLRTVGDANNRFSEDFLRMLRSIRFSSRMDFTITDDVKAAIKNNAEKIMKIAPERVTAELFKMAEQTGSKLAQAIYSMKELDILKYILPEIDKMSDFKHSTTYHPEGGVFDHVLAALKSYTGNDPFVNLSILFHDVGKINTYDNSEGKHSYHGHDKAGSDLIDIIAQRMKFDNTLKTCLKFCAENHMKMHNITEMGKNKIINLMNSPFWDILVTVSECDSKARGSLFNQKEWDDQMLNVSEIKKKYGTTKPEDALKKTISGQLVIDTLNIKPGPNVGLIQKKAIEKAVEANIDLTDIDKIKEIIKSVSIF